MIRLRIAAGLFGATAFLAVAAPLTAAARRAGVARPPASVLLHRWLCRTLRIRVARVGSPGPARRLIVANHVSWLDILVLGSIEPMAFLAKREVGSSPWTRWLVDLQGVVYVDRQRKRAIPAVNAAMARKMMAGSPVVLFAEATTNDGVRLLRFRSSHFEAARTAGAFVQPVYLDFRAVSGLTATRAEKAIVAWYGDMAFLPSLWRVIRCGGVTCEVRYGDPIPAAPDRKTLARQTEAAVRALKARRTRDGA